MADSTHTLEIELRTKDFATESMKRVGEAGKQAGEQVTKSMGGADTTTRTFAERWLKLDGDFTRVARVGVGAISSINAGIATANATSDNFGKTILSAGASIASGFASGGPVGGALAATSAAIGLIVNQFDSAGEAARKLAQDMNTEMAPAIQRLTGSNADAISKIMALQKQYRREAEINGRVLAGESRNRVVEEMEYEAIVRDLNQALRDRETAAYRAEEAVKRSRTAGLPGKEEYEQFRLAGEAVDQAREALRVAEQMRTERGGQLALAEQLARVEAEARNMLQEQERLKTHQQAIDWQRKQASAAMTDELVRQANEMLRLNSLTEDQLKVDKLVTVEEQLRLRGRKDLADALRRMIDDQLRELQQARDLTAEEKERKKELEDYRDIMAGNAKEMGFFAEGAKQAKEHLKGAASLDLAKPIRDAAGELKKLQGGRAPGRGGARFDEEGNFLGLGLAEARQERRDALRSRKRRRAEAGRMGFGLGETSGMRTGRRAGGLGAFSVVEGEAGDMGIVQAGEEGTPSFFAEQRKRKKFAPPTPMAQLPIIGGGQIAGAQLDLELLNKQTGAAKSLADQMKVLNDNTRQQADSLGNAAASGEDIIGEAVRAAEAASRIADNMSELVVKISDFAERIETVEQRTERLLEAARLRGGN